ncbi:MAG: RNA polymerase-associated protein RapA [Gammaproteobacteria bacterium]|nr:RNA polymerase-associated protein RapA [Gammaproteobacteria bacterium]
MQEFSIGQRWISAAELQLGLGMVIEIEHRTVSIIFPATAEVRTYARQDAPLTRVRFNPGDWVQNQSDDLLQVVALQESGGLILYQCENETGDAVNLPEGKLNNYLQLNRPGERLLNGQIDRNKWFSLRTRARQIANELLQSPIFGLAGCRTSLIAHQLYIAHEVSHRFAPRVLLADEVGLGKTIEAGLILHQQLLLERAHRVLIVVPESLVHQWLVEMLRRFNLMFSVFDENRCLAIEETDEDGVGNGDNPFHTEQLVICSLQFLVNQRRRCEQALQGEWDLLVVDEAHHLAWSAESVSEEYRAIELLASKTPGLLLLTATPEQLGKESHFARLRLLDPNRFGDLDSFLQDESSYARLADLVEVLQQEGSLQDTQWQMLQETLVEGDNQQWLDKLVNEDEESRDLAKLELIEHLLDRHGTGRVLFRNTRHVVQGFPEREIHAYALKTNEQWMQAWHKSQTTQGELQILLSPELAPGMETVWLKYDPRINWLGDFLCDYKKRKVLVITASATTALSLVEQVKLNHGIRAAVFHDGMTLIERDRAAADFADHETGAQVLICSEIGSEGRNFQFAHHLVLFDLPLNPDLLEQRIGRLDRIGQNAVINIHVPYLQQSAQAVMFRWYDEGMNAFRHTCPAGHSVYMQMQKALDKQLRESTLPIDEFIDQTAKLHDELNLALQQGRDKLLEINSCRPQLAEALTDQAMQRDYEMDIFKFMERIYDCYGVNSEIRGQDSWVITPSDNMLTKMPGLPDDGMTVTYRRNVALANEDVHFLSWEHPFVRNAMDLILSSEFGNTALIAIKYAGVKPGSLLVDSHFLMEFSDNASLGNSRFFPSSSIAIVLDEQGKQHGHILDRNVIKQLLQRVDIDTSLKIVKARQTELGDLLQAAETAAEQQLPELIESARQRGKQVLGKEIDRLTALQKINPSVRDEEIEFFRDQLRQFETSLSHARFRLDAVRVMVAI